MELRLECERCHVALRADGTAYFCAHDCTFCATCYRQLKYICPNCSGELVRRPRLGPYRPPAPRTHAIPAGALTVRRATAKDLDAVAPLFDAYRQFYEQPADPAASRQFLRDRLAHDESVVFVAEENGIAVGFTQLYPLYSSVSLGPIHLLNDLFVAPNARRKGVGEKLLETARAYGGATGSHYLELSTAVDNPAQGLYEACGWAADREFLHYELLLRKNSSKG